MSKRRQTLLLWAVILIVTIMACGGVRGKCQQYNSTTDSYENVPCPPELEESDDSWLIGPTHIEKEND